MDPVVIWPAAVSLWAGGYVATARRVYITGTKGLGEPSYSRNEAMGFALFWPVWVPLMYAGMAVRAGWLLASRLIFGDLGDG